jgi:hypothetical protein
MSAMGKLEGMSWDIADALGVGEFMGRKGINPMILPIVFLILLVAAAFFLIPPGDLEDEAVEPTTEAECVRGVYDESSGKCLHSPVTVNNCEEGKYNPNTDKCELTPNVEINCENGVYDPMTEECIYSPPTTTRCQTGSFNSLTGECVVEGEVVHICEEGEYDSTTGECVVTVNKAERKDCERGEYNENNGKCEYDPGTKTICLEGTYDSSLDLCIIEPSISYNCPRGYLQYDNSGNPECVINAPRDNQDNESEAPQENNESETPQENNESDNGTDDPQFPNPTFPRPPQVSRGDINGDNVINEKDLAIIATYLEDGGNISGTADYNADGSVDLTDYSCISFLISGDMDSYESLSCNQTLSVDASQSPFGIFSAYTHWEYPHILREMNFEVEDYYVWVRHNFAELGARWTRLGMGVIWDYFEPEIGQGYVWDNQFEIDHSALAANHSSYPVNVLGVLHMGGGSESNKDKALRNPLDFPDEYSRFVTDLVERFDGDGVDDAPNSPTIKYWQVGNEIGMWIMNSGKGLQEYVSFVRLASQAIGEANPDTGIVLMAPISDDPSAVFGETRDTRFLSDAVKQLSDVDFDAIDIHHWQAADDWKIPHLQEYRQLLDSQGLEDVEIWSCEHGTWAGDPDQGPAQDEGAQAESLIKRYVYNLANDADRIMWNNLVEWENFAGQSGTKFNSMGLISDGRGAGEDPEMAMVKRLAYYSYQLLAKSLIGADGENIQKLSESGIYAYRFDTIKGPVWIAWSEEGPREWTLSTDKPSLTVTMTVPDAESGLYINADHEAFSPVSVNINGSLTLRLSDIPVIIKEARSPEYCGDEVCQKIEEETGLCPQDCGEPAPICGDGNCDSDESCSDCPSDCGTCEQTCSSQGGDDCYSVETCPGDWLTATDSDRCCSSTCQAPATSGDQLFIYQGDYNQLGDGKDIGELLSEHDVAVITNVFPLSSVNWTNGDCISGSIPRDDLLDALKIAREINPDILIFGYVPATADDYQCWDDGTSPYDCPGGTCTDFMKWVNLWLSLESEPGITIDGIFIDMTYPSYITTATRDNVFSYVKGMDKLIMANALTDSTGLSFAYASPQLTPEDYILVEGYYFAAGQNNPYTSEINSLLSQYNINWAALTTEDFNVDITCGSYNMQLAYGFYKQYGGSAFAYQSADIGSQSGEWVLCPNYG